MINTRTKREIATDILRDLFADRSRITIAEAVEAGRAVDVSRQTLTRAARDLGVREIHNGPYPAFWERKSNPLGPPLKSPADRR